ncbi:hypothetical protein BDV98DRAFT_573374 [Pterulicium gracile]|uniref:Uncharacterized protein n=1 Tax=Pterulicium gracile TaxID=1884261 RepID=A0A5C3Q8Y9_9AGAR|nr:hypothetical protein BDV98DRAFT_573374 [Pterula gracilis]
MHRRRGGSLGRLVRRLLRRPPALRLLFSTPPLPPLPLTPSTLRHSPTPKPKPMPRKSKNWKISPLRPVHRRARSPSLSPFRPPTLHRHRRSSLLRSPRRGVCMIRRGRGGLAGGGFRGRGRSLRLSSFPSQLVHTKARRTIGRSRAGFFLRTILHTLRTVIGS